MKLTDLKFEQVEMFNEGELEPQWVAINPWRDTIAFGATKEECEENALAYCEDVNKREKNTKMKDLTFEKVESYDPFNSRSKSNGMVTEWAARNQWGHSVAFGDTKAECIENARRYICSES